MAWEAERAAQDHARSSRVGNPPHQGQSYYTNNGESYSDKEDINPTFVTPTPHQRVNVQTPPYRSSSPNNQNAIFGSVGCTRIQVAAVATI
ncbi:hypothetical protein LIER_28773 [Lithospermum erythrorhizon]|uniref:Uncharacterized protein n=1 Tax=Lithospermum erythrorhizon TaxID=34254 RepID=A0AAV3RKH7_LITER